MKTIIPFIVATISVMCSCVSKHEDNNKSVNITNIIAEYDRSLKDTAFLDSVLLAHYQTIIDDTISNPNNISQGLCCAEQWWSDIKVESSKDSILNNAALLYNINALSNSIYADYEIWQRGYECGSSLVEEDTLINNISKVNVDMISDAKYRKEAEKLRDGIVWCLKNTDDVTEKRNPPVMLHLYDSITKPFIHSLLDSAAYVHYDSIVETTIERYDAVQQNLAKISDDKVVREMLLTIQNAKTFDDQCGILLACSRKSETFDELWSIKLMKVFMDSGHYSVLLCRMWQMWRAFCQERWCGMSRDSCIPNYSYDKVRKKVYETIIGYLQTKPKDKDAVGNAVMLAYHTPLIRNGECLFGNDCPLEILTYCPEFYGERNETDSIE